MEMYFAKPGLNFDEEIFLSNLHNRNKENNKLREFPELQWQK